MKEYEEVFPGLPLFIKIFHGMSAINKYNDVIEAITKQMSYNRFEDPNAKDFAILGSAQQVFMPFTA